MIAIPSDRHQINFVEGECLIDQEKRICSAAASEAAWRLRISCRATTSGDSARIAVASAWTSGRADPCTFHVSTVQVDGASGPDVAAGG